MASNDNNTPRLPLCFNSMGLCECRQCAASVWVCVCTARLSWGRHRTKITLLSVTVQFLLSAVAGLLNITCFPFTHTCTHTHTVSQSEVRKGSPLLTWSPGWQGRSCHRGHQSSWGVSCGSSLHLGCFRCCCCVRCAAKRQFKYHFITISSNAVVEGLLKKEYKTPTRRGPPVVPGFSEKTRERCMRESVSCEQYWLLFLVTSGATNDCVSNSVKIVKLPIKNKVSDWSWIIQIIQMTPICWFVFIRISCHSLQRASLDKKWQKMVINSGCISTNSILSSKRMTRTLDINTVWSPRFIHIISKLSKKQDGTHFPISFGYGGV